MVDLGVQLLRADDAGDRGEVGDRCGPAVGGPRRGGAALLPLRDQRRQAAHLLSQPVRAAAVLPGLLDELGRTPADSIAYICGNPDRILAAEAILLDRDYPEEQIRKELYWPKGKAPKGAAMGSAPAED